MKAAPSERNRVGWIDLAKFIGIFAIVYGHTIQEGLSCKYVYSFHVPLFFLLQGVVFSVTQGERKPFGQYIKKKMYTLLVPYACFAVISTAVIYVASRFVSVPDMDIFSSAADLMINLLMGDCEANSPLWFLPSSFCLSVIAYWVILWANKQEKSAVRTGILAASAAVGCVALYVTEEFTGIKLLPWKIDAAIHMLPFFIGGYVLEEYGLFHKFSKLSTGLKLVITALLLGVGAALGLLNDSANYLSNYYGSIPVTYVAGMASCVGICLLSMQLPNVRVLSAVGRSSLSVMLMHKFPVLFFCTVIPFTAAPLKERSIPVALLVTVISIALCCVAEWILAGLCPFVIGRRRKRALVKTQ